MKVQRKRKTPIRLQQEYLVEVPGQKKRKPFSYRRSQRNRNSKKDAQKGAEMSGEETEEEEVKEL